MADDGIAVPYNLQLTPLEAVLSGVRRPGDFFVHGAHDTAMPRVEVDGVRVLSFPVPLGQVRQLIQQAVRAPYGRGRDTIVDESVRKVWQVSPDRVRVGGRSWGRTFQHILSTVTHGLGCGDTKVSAELYKLLVYDKGGFFKAHRDTEKVEGMFGTLVVVLPSAHRGGDLILRHAGREISANLSTTEVSELTFAAFYADCEHEARPITSGNRVCLVYNLVQPRTGKKRRSLTAPLY
ncbi:MAG: 2OG-Fe(II) oxygenase [Vicinamibacteraceae bacterium]